MFNIKYYDYYFFVLYKKLIHLTNKNHFFLFVHKLLFQLNSYHWDSEIKYVTDNFMQTDVCICSMYSTHYFQIKQMYKIQKSNFIVLICMFIKCLGIYTCQIKTTIRVCIIIIVLI